MSVELTDYSPTSPSAGTAAQRRKTRSAAFAVAGLFILLGGLAFPMMAQSASAQSNASEFIDPVEEVSQKASDAMATVRELFNDGRVQNVVVLVLIVLGLTLWLLGARAGRLLFALLLGTAAVIPGMYLAAVLELPLWPGALAGGLLGMLVGVFIFRIGLMLVGMCISTLLTVGVFAVTRVDSNDLVDLKNSVQNSLISVQQQEEPATPYMFESANGQTAPATVGDDWQQLADTISRLAQQYHSGLLVSAVAGLAIGLLLQIFARSFMLVLTTACLGTTMVLSGVWLGLLFREKEPEKILGLKPISTAVIFLVMLALGMLVQLTMTRKRSEPKTEEEEE